MKAYRVIKKIRWSVLWQIMKVAQDTNDIMYVGNDEMWACIGICFYSNYFLSTINYMDFSDNLFDEYKDYCIRITIYYM